MICLDTNYLIRMLVPGSSEAVAVAAWYKSNQPLITPMLAWYEFLCGPVTDQQEAAVRAFVSRIVPIDESQVRLAAALFNHAGRKRRNRIDALIAATAIQQRARLATSNREDFSPFESEGLEVM